MAVRTMSTRDTGSSIQSTGTSWMRSPLCSASTNSSVSKNQPWSSTKGRSSRATSARRALKPHWASEKPARNVVRRSRLYPREMSSRFGPRTTRAFDARRVPMATSLWPLNSGATSGRSASRSVERSTSMYATTARVARAPRGAERTTAALLVEVEEPHAFERRGQSARDHLGVVGARVVDDGDRPRHREVVGEIRLQGADRRVEVVFLVEDGHDDLHRRCERHRFGGALNGGLGHERHGPTCRLRRPLVFLGVRRERPAIPGVTLPASRGDPGGGPQC